MFRYFIWLYFILFLLLWSIRELWLVNYLNMEPIIRGIVSAGVKICIWTIPVFIIIKRIEKRDPFTYLGLRHNFKKGLKWAGMASFALITYFFIVNLMIMNKEIDLSMGFNSWLNTIILAGITEEIVFRGFILKKLSKLYKFWEANIITSILFVMIHFPIWLRLRLFETPNIIGIVINVFVISLVFGYMYKRTGSLWSVIIFHSVYNLSVLVFN